MCFSKEISKPLGLLTNEDEAIVTERGGGERKERLLNLYITIHYYKPMQAP